MGLFDSFMPGESGGIPQRSLLDGFADPNTVGLLTTAAGLLSASGPSRMPVSLGQALGSGVMAGMQGYQQTKHQQDQDQMQKLQMAMLMQKFGKEQRIQDFLARRFGGNTDAGSQSAQTQPGISASSAQAFGLPPTSATPDAPSPAAAISSKPGVGGTFPLSMEEIGMLTVSGVPGAKELFDLYKYSNDGVKREAGNYYDINGKRIYLPKLGEGQTLGPDGSVINMAGSVESNARFKGAETAATEGAKAGLDFVQVPMKDGSTRMMRRDQAAAVMGGALPAVPGVGTGGMLPGFGVSQSPGDKTYADETAKSVAEQYKQIQNAGFQAPGKIAKYQQLAQLLANHDGGKLSGAGLDIAQTANSLGLKIDKNLANKEAAQALTNELALSLRNPSGGEGMPGAMSDADREFLMRSVPNMSQSAQGRNEMVQMQTKVLQRQADVAKMARQWQQRYGRLDAANPNTGRSFFDNLQAWTDQNPLFQQPAQ